MNIPFNVDLSGEVAAITGAGGVLMSEFARALAMCGAKVALMDLSYDNANKYAKEIGDSALAVQCNCLDKDSIQAAKDKINEKFGKITLLINGAGGNNAKAQTEIERMTPSFSGDGTFFNMEEAGFRFVFDLNMTTAFLVTQVICRDMTETGGNIINITSMNAYRPLTKIPAYSAAKSALGNFTQWLAVHFAPCNIRCNAIAPGFFSTKQNRDLLFNADGTPSDRTAKILKSTPMNRFGEADELIGALLFLASREASGFVTGISIPVDGGFSAYSGV